MIEPTLEQWRARALHAEERVRFIAALMKIPDGGRYQNDIRECADLAEQNRELRLALFSWLDKPHHTEDRRLLLKALPFMWRKPMQAIFDAYDKAQGA